MYEHNLQILFGKFKQFLCKLMEWPNALLKEKYILMAYAQCGYLIQKWCVFSYFSKRIYSALHIAEAGWINSVLQ